MMKISPQRVEEVMRAFAALQRELEVLHAEGQRPRDCVGWPECDCRLAEQIRWIVQIENEWQAKGERL
jgi:hypothetical protein